jgi:HK97 family phage prohead protease
MSYAERFNPNHAPAGAGGGQFTSAGGGGGKAPAKGGPKEPQAAKQHAGHEAHLAHMRHLASHPIGEGESGPQVRSLQERLNELGFHLAPDGKFGPETLAAVRAFQRARKDASGRPLAVDGLVGPLTAGALELRPPAEHHAPAHHAAPRKAPGRPAHAAGASAHAARTAQTAEASTVHKPFGNPAGPGLWHTGHQLPAYIQSVAHHLATQGHDESRAIEMAVGIVRNWAAGHDGHGNQVSAQVQAAAVKAMAEWEKLRAQAHADNNKGGGMSRSVLMRDYPLEDLHIVRSGDGGDGRTMEAFAAVFNTETEIRDFEGRYLEVIEPAAFNKRLADLQRSRQGFGQVKVLFNHGCDNDGKSAERFQMPVAVPVSIEASTRGLLTRSRFVNTPLGDEVLELVRSGAVTAMSFQGRIVRSTPPRQKYGRYAPDSSGRLTTVRRMELGLHEYGPVLFPAYEGAGINGVRMSTPGAWEPDEELYDEALPPDGEAAAGGPQEDLHPSRMNAHRLWQIRNEEACREAGIVLPGRG